LKPTRRAAGKRAELADRLLQLLYSSPIQTIQSVEKRLDISTATAGSLLREFEKRHIVQEITGRQRGRLYAMTRYLAIF
jgi:fic family protein